MVFDPSKIEKIVQLARIYGATRLIRFGSAKDAPQTARDVDIACDGVQGWKLFELAVLPHCGHNTYAEKPEEYQRITLSFFERQH